MYGLCPLLGQFFVESVTDCSNDHIESLYESELWMAGYGGNTEIGDL